MLVMAKQSKTDDSTVIIGSLNTKIQAITKLTYLSNVLLMFFVSKPSVCLLAYVFFEATVVAGDHALNFYRCSPG